MGRETVERIGVIGLGRMGAPVARRLAEAGFRVTVFDADPARGRAAAAAGLTPSQSVQKLSRGVNVVVTVLPGPEEVTDVMAGPSGVLESLRPGTCWLDLTSNDPEVAAGLAAEAEARDIECVGAPMGGGPSDAAAGTLTFYVGGASDAAFRVTPILRALADSAKIISAGTRMGDGYVTKLLANTLWFGQALAVTEALLLGQASGLDLRILRNDLETSAGGSVFLTHHVDALLEGDYLTTFGVDRVVEELLTVTRLAKQAGTPHELTELVTKLHQDALNRFGPIDGELLGARLLEVRAGRTLRADRRTGGH